MESFHQVQSEETPRNETIVERLREELKRVQQEKQKSAEAGIMLCGENEQLREQMQKHREKTSKEIETLLKENSTMKKRYEDMRKERERTEEENINLYEELRTMRERVTAELKARHESEMKTIRQKLEKARDEADAALAAANEARAEMKRASSELEHVRRLQNATMNATLIADDIEGQARADIDRLSAENVSIVELYVHIRENILQEAHIATIDELRETLTTLQSEKYSLSDEVQQLQRDLTEQRAYVDELKSVIEEKTSKLEELEQELLTARTTGHTRGNNLFSELDDQRRDAEVAAILLERRFDEMKVRNEQLREECERMKRQLRLDFIRLALGDDNEEAPLDTFQYTDKIRRLEDEVRSLKKELDMTRRRGDVAKILDEIAVSLALGNQRYDTEDLREAGLRAMKQLEAEKQVMRETNEELRRQLREVDAEKREKAKQIKELLRARNQLEFECTELKERVRSDAKSSSRRGAKGSDSSLAVDSSPVSEADVAALNHGKKNAATKTNASTSDANPVLGTNQKKKSQPLTRQNSLKQEVKSKSKATVLTETNIVKEEEKPEECRQQ